MVTVTVTVTKLHDTKKSIKELRRIILYIL